jgi:serine/threonine protein kinase
MAPEVDEKHFTQASDVWALGCILIELTTTSIYTEEELRDKIKETNIFRLKMSKI